MPDVKVEAAFGSGYATPAASRAWTDISAWVELNQGIAINFGRGDELSTADANTLTLTLDNSDGRFTALRAASPYYPNVRIGTPVRVTTTPVGGSPSVRFVGFVDEWPMTWDGTDATSLVTVTASSRLARIGLGAELKSLGESILSDGPIAYYPLTEAVGATAGHDISGYGRAVITRSNSNTTFGTGAGLTTDKLPAPQLIPTNVGPPRGTRIQGTVALPAMSSCTIEGFFALASGNASPGLRVICLLGPNGALYEINVVETVVEATYSTDVGGVKPIASSNMSLLNGAVHHLAATFQGGATSTITLYVDGVSVASGSAVGVSLATFDTIRVGPHVADSGTQPASVGHVAVYDAVLSADQIAQHARAGIDGFAGESTNARLVRYAALAGVAATEIVAEPGATTVGHVDTTGQTAIDLMRRVETTEGGVLFDAPDGTLTFHGRSHRYQSAPTLTLDMAAQRVGADFAPKLDRTGLVNDATVSNLDGTVTARAVDAASRDYYGPATMSTETISTDANEPFQAASWQVAVYAEPKVRVPSLSVNLLDFDAAPSQGDVLGATVGTLVAVTNQPAQAASSTGKFFIEGYAETIGPTSYSLVFNVSPAEPWVSVARFDDAAHGFDTGSIFAY
ncbi:MAG: hypothetical protein HOQ45_02390 [Nocardioidaceae bacterium]|nr:hypothetical protein [Nocardioidaceae bacterium]